MYAAVKVDGVHERFHMRTSQSLVNISWVSTQYWLSTIEKEAICMAPKEFSVVRNMPVDTGFLWYSLSPSLDSLNRGSSLANRFPTKGYWGFPLESTEFQQKGGSDRSKAISQAKTSVKKHYIVQLFHGHYNDH
jgi:hypothetical protein